jgi:3-deoxy-7-phosphoheptulonate synthase
MKLIRKLPEAEELFEKYALTEEQKINRINRINEIQNVLSSEDGRKLLIVGPCSADREDAILDYMGRLAKLQEEVQDCFLIVPRVYTSKPRTNGTGYKGLLHSPLASDTQEDMLEGVIAVRKLHLHVIQNTGLFAADEMLYPESTYYIKDLLAYVAVGARSVEDQLHRMTASGIEIPVGLKNPTGGDTTALLNSVMAAQRPQRMIFRGWETYMEGNPYAHAILRGYVDKNGKMYPNYHYEHLRDFYDDYQKFQLKNNAVIVDCNHCNSGKNYELQIRIAKEVMGLCKDEVVFDKFIKGFMIESYLVDGKQLVGGGVYGQSLTDGCLGWEKTVRLIKTLREDM